MEYARMSLSVVPPGGVTAGIDWASADHAACVVGAADEAWRGSPWGTPPPGSRRKPPRGDPISYVRPGRADLYHRSHPAREGIALQGAGLIALLLLSGTVKVLER